LPDHPFATQYWFFRVTHSFVITKNVLSVCTQHSESNCFILSTTMNGFVLSLELVETLYEMLPFSDITKNETRTWDWTTFYITQNCSISSFYYFFLLRHPELLLLKFITQSLILSIFITLSHRFFIFVATVMFWINETLSLS
jgi:hypothetical protein